jgi:serine/threonine protein kinase
MLEQSNDQHRLQFFERVRSTTTGSVGGRDEWAIKQVNTGKPSSTSSKPPQSQQPQSQQPQSQQSQSQQPKQKVIPSSDPIASLTEVIRAETHRKKKYPPSETGNSPRNYELFVDLIYRMLSYDPRKRITPDEALNHPFITAGDSSSSSQQHAQQHSQHAHPQPPTTTTTTTTSVPGSSSSVFSDHHSAARR